MFAWAGSGKGPTSSLLPTSTHPPFPQPPKTSWGKGSNARSFFMASWPRSQRAGDWVVWAEFLSLPVGSLQLVNMKPGAGRIWPLSCQQSAHLESRKVVLGAPRSWAQGSPTPPGWAVDSSLAGVGLHLPEPPSEPPASCASYLLLPLAVPQFLLCEKETCCTSVGGWMGSPGSGLPGTLGRPVEVSEGIEGSRSWMSPENSEAPIISNSLLCV